MDSVKRVLVTGASEGIGRAFAKRFANDGFNVTGVARNKQRLDELSRELPKGDHCMIVADLSTSSGVEEIKSELTHRKYNILVNNAGFGVYGQFSSTPLERFQEMTRLNCDALVALSHAFLQSAEAGDALLNVSSTLAFLPMPTGGLYAATKAFVTSFTESLWFEQKEKGIFVMGLCPGITETQFHARSGGKPNELPKALTQTPEEVVNVAMKALLKRKSPTVISGAKNFIMAAALSRIMPRKTSVQLMGKARS